MLSRLLAVLALMSGLAVFGVPVEARSLASGSQQQVEVRQASSSVAQVATHDELVQIPAISAERASTGSFNAGLTPASADATVRIGVDRAHE